MAKSLPPDLCPCGSAKPIADCCGRFIDACQGAPDAETLMRSRYTAYVLARPEYLRHTWHTSTCPADLDLASAPQPRWLGLEIKSSSRQDESHATVEFVARYKIAGRAVRLHELSRFIRENDRWLYVDGDLDPT